MKRSRILEEPWGRLRPTLSKYKTRWKQIPLRFQPVYYRSSVSNVYHCTTHKAGSQWIRAILSDRRTYAYSGLLSYQYVDSLPGSVDPRRYGEKSFKEPFPPGTIATPCYFHHDDFAVLPKAGEYRAIFVVRDPRDILVSWYFSLRYSHGLMGNVAELRSQLESHTIEDGFKFLTDYIDQFGVFRAMRSWLVAVDDPRVLVVRFEDLIDHSRAPEEFRKVFEHCDVGMPSDVIRRVLDTYSFKAMSGRNSGEEDQRSHYRKGTSGDWTNYLDSEAEEAVAALAGDVIAGFGFDGRRD